MTSTISHGSPGSGPAVPPLRREVIVDAEVVDEEVIELAEDAAVALADTLLLTVPNQLGVEYNAELLRNVAEHVAPAIGWAPADQVRG